MEDENFKEISKILTFKENQSFCCNSEIYQILDKDMTFKPVQNVQDSSNNTEDEALESDGDRQTLPGVKQQASIAYDFKIKYFNKNVSRYSRNQEERLVKITLNELKDNASDEV